MDLPRGRQTHPPWRPHFMRRRRTKEKPADCQGCRRARLCPVRGTHTKSASFKDRAAGLTGRYRTSYPRLDLLLRSDELILLRYHFTRTAISQRRTVSLRRASHGYRGAVAHRRGCDELSGIGRNTDLTLDDAGLGAILRLSLRVANCPSE